MSESGIDDLIKDKEISLQKILVNMMTSGKDLSLKTEINDVLRMSLFSYISEFLRSFEVLSQIRIVNGKTENYWEISDDLDYLITIIKENAISHLRKGRTEVFGAVANLLEKEREKNIFEKMGTNLKQ